MKSAARHKRCEGAKRGCATVKSTQRRAIGRPYTALIIVVLALGIPLPLANAAIGTGPAEDRDFVELAASDLVSLDLPDVAAPQIDDPISKAELEDLKTLASQEGTSLQDAIDRYAWNDNFALAVSIVREKHPEALAGAEIVGARGAWVGFAADAPDAALEIIMAFEKAHPAVAVQVRPGFGFSEIELGRAIATVHYAELAIPGVRDATTTFDYEIRQITTAVAFSGAAHPGTAEIRRVAIDRLVETGLGKLLDSISVNAVETNMPVLSGLHSNTEHLGGEALSDCTSGFTVQHWNGTTGIVTAQHCQDNEVDDGVALTYKLGHDGTWGDFQWHTGPQTEPDDFYSGSSTALEVNGRDVAAWASPVVGQSICKNGKAGFKDCDTVRKKHVCSLIWCELIMTEHQYGVPGDSGGPWFWNYTAYGVHHGWDYDPVWPFDRSLFSDVTFLFNALDIQVRK